jgi:hypothetical protein
MPPAKNVQRQIAVGFVIAVKEAPFLLAMQRIVGGVEVERDLARRRAMRFPDGRSKSPGCGHLKLPHLIPPCWAADRPQSA